PGVESETLGGESIRGAPARGGSAAPLRLLRGQVEDEGQVRAPAPRGDAIDRLDALPRHAPAEALIGERRVGEPVAQDGPPGRESGLDHLAKMLAPAREDEQQLDRAVDLAPAGVEEQAADRIAEGSPPGLVRGADVHPALGEPRRGPAKLARLAAPVDPFEGHEPAARRHGAGTYHAARRAGRKVGAIR